jgi:hypothetical protein
MNVVPQNPYAVSPNKRGRGPDYVEDERAARDMGALRYTNGDVIRRQQPLLVHTSPTKPKTEERFLGHLATANGMMFNNFEHTYVNFANLSTLGLAIIPVTAVQMTRVMDNADEYIMQTSETVNEYIKHLDLGPNNQIFVRELLSRQYASLQKARGLLSLAEAKIKKRITDIEDMKDTCDCLATQVEELLRASRDAAVHASSPVIAAEVTAATDSTTAAGTN